MKLEQQVCSFEQAKKLKELGVKQESLFYWNEKAGVADFYNHFMPTDRNISAFTVAELGEMLKKSDYYLPYSSENWGVWECRVGNTEDGEKQNLQAPTEADARAAMLIYLLANKLITL